MLLLPSTPILKLQPILELRTRLERRLNRDFSEATDDSSTGFFGRVRVGAGLTARSLKGQIVYQYADGENYNFNTHVSVKRSDLVLGFAQGKLGQANFTVGRQRLTFGSDRLLGQGEWNNISNAWDGVRASIGPGELFVVKCGLLPSPIQALSLYGGTYAVGPFQGLIVVKHDGRNDIDEATISTLVRRQFGRLQFDAEAAGQVGHRAGKRKLAGAFDAIATVPVAPKLTFSVQGSIASGGGQGDTTNTFDQLYPSSHDKHGLLDMAGWQNLRDLGLWFRYDPDRSTSVKLQYHRFGLDSARDAWYGGGGAPNGRPGGLFVDPAGKSGRDLGDEIDLDASRTLNPHQTVRAGFGVFRPGNFVRAFNGASTQDQFFAYAQFNYRF